MKFYISDLSLWALAIFYLPVAIYALYRVARSPAFQGSSKALAVTVTVIVLYAIPLGDVTLNSIAMAKMCPKAGLHVYKKVQVEGYYDPGGHSKVLETYPYKFIETGDFNDRVLRWERQSDGTILQSRQAEPTAQYEVVYEHSKYIKELRTTRTRYSVRNRVTGEVVGEWLQFGVRPGWIDQALVIRWFGGSLGGCMGGPEAYEFREKILPPKQQ